MTYFDIYRASPPVQYAGRGAFIRSGEVVVTLLSGLYPCCWRNGWGWWLGLVVGAGWVGAGGGSWCLLVDAWGRGCERCSVVSPRSDSAASLPRAP